MSIAINLNSKILVTGAAGMVGSALVNALTKTYKNIHPLTRTDCDLEDSLAVDKVFKSIDPDFVFHIAAKVGGIGANIADPVGFLRSNLLSQLNVLDTCHNLKSLKKILVLGSSCIYPKDCSQPMVETDLMTGKLEPTNEGYAMAKLVGLSLVQAYHKQYLVPACFPLPCNIYGPNDSFDLKHCHVLSALVKRFTDAKRLNAPTVTLWGTGKARREFIYIDDVVDGILFLMNSQDSPQPINLGPGTDVSILELANTIAEMVSYSGKIIWNTDKPDGMARKLMDVSKLNELGYHTKTSLNDGIAKVIVAYSSLNNN